MRFRLKKTVSVFVFCLTSYVNAGIIQSIISALAECYECVNIEKCSRCSGGFSFFIYCNDILCPLAPSSVIGKCSVLIYDGCYHLKRTEANLNVSLCVWEDGFSAVKPAMLSTSARWRL